MSCYPDVADRTTAAVAFKNAVLHDWHDDDPNATPVFSVAEKDFVRNCILELAISQREPPIANQLAEASRRIFGHDYPDRWPTLPAQLLALLRRGEPHAAAATTGLVREMAKHYQFKADEAQAPLRMLIEAIFPTLAAAVTHCLPPGGATAWPPGSPELPPEAGLVVVHVLKALYSATHLHLTQFPSIAASAPFSEWAMLVYRVAALELPLPGEGGQPAGMPVDEEDRPKWSWWRARKWALKIFATWTDRFGKPSLTIAGSPDHAVATALNKAVAPRLSTLLLAQLRAWGGVDGAPRRYLPPSVIYNALRFLQTAVGFASAWRGGLSDSLPFLLRVVVPAIVQLAPAELEMMNDEPAEYMRSVADPFGTMGSSRYAALLLLSEAVRSRGEQARPQLEAHLRDVFMAHANKPTLATALAKEAALAMLTEVSSEYWRTRTRRTTLMPILATFVTPELASPFVPLRSRAASVWGTFADMAPPKGTIPCYADATAGVLRIVLDDPSPVVRCTAAVALRALLASAPGTENVVRPSIIPVLRRLFADLEAVGLEEVVETITVIVQVFADELPTIALPIVSQIVTLWRRTMDKMTAAEADGGGGSGDGFDGDEAALAAEGMVSAVRTVVDVLVEARRIDVLRLVLPALWPLLRDVIDPELAESDGITGPVESLDAAMGLLGDIIDVFSSARAPEWAAGTDDDGEVRSAAPGAPFPGELAASPDLMPVWALLPRLLKVYTSAALDFVDDLVATLDGLLQDPPSFARLVANVPDPASSVVLLPALLDCVAFTEENGDEDTRATMASFCMGILHWGHGGPADPVLPRLVSIYVGGALLPGAPNPARTASLQGRLEAFVTALFTYNARAALALVDAVAPGGGALASILPPLLATLPQLTRRSFYAKAAMIGLANLVRSIPLAEMPPALQVRGSLALCVASVKHGLRVCVCSAPG